MTYSLLVVLREALEAGIIIALALSYLRKLDQMRYRWHVLLGGGAALFLSIAAGAALELSSRSISGRAMEIMEGSAMLFAAAMLTLMIFWMARQAATLGANLRQDVRRALERGSPLTLSLLAFTAVGREGLETVLFLFAGSTTTSTSLYWLGAAIGLLIAMFLAYLIYLGSARLPLKAFFNVTGVLLIVLAAGLISNGLKELLEAGVITSLGPHVWDTYNYVPDNSQLGRFLATVLGYDSSPHLFALVAYVGYLGVALVSFIGLRRWIAPQRTGQLIPARPLAPEAEAEA